MPTVRSRTFRSGNSEAVRLPKEVSFGVDVPVTIVRSGEVMTIFPARPSVRRMLERLAALPGPGEIEERDVEPLPERPDL